MTVELTADSVTEPVKRAKEGELDAASSSSSWLPQAQGLDQLVQNANGASRVSLW